MTKARYNSGARLGLRAEHPHCKIRGDPVAVLRAEIVVTARPGVLLGIRDHPGAHRIEMDVAQEFEEVAVDVD